MKFITVQDIRTSPAQIWKQLCDEQELVITSNGKPIALLTPISDDTLEQTLSAIRRARAANALRRMQQISRDRGLDQLTEEEIETGIRAARHNKQK